MFHFQKDVPEWPKAVDLLPDSALVKAVDRGDILRDVKAINPNITTMLRHWGGTQSVFGGDLEHNKSVARSFFETFIDGTFLSQYAPHVDLVQEWNEYLASSHSGDKLAERITWAEAAAWVWKHEYQTRPEINRDGNPIRLALVNAPIGNDIHPRFAEIALEYGCVLSYHAYSHYIDGKRDPHDFRYHSGRWNEMEKQWGLYPEWVFGEAGPYASVTDGWRSAKCQNGNREAYVEAVRAFIEDTKQTPAYQQGRILGFSLFTTGGGSKWSLYETRQPEMSALARMIATEWNPGSAPTPPPDPGPEPREYKRKVWLLPGADATSSEYDLVKDRAFPLRNTVTFSADDAFIDHPNLTERQVTVVEVERIAGSGGREALEEWVEEYYPPLPDEIQYLSFSDLAIARHWDAPVGTPSERNEPDLWPGRWEDNNPFMNQYSLGYHTGADLNLNDPLWDADRNMPVYPAANGQVIYADIPSSSWRGVIIVRHELPDGEGIVYTRYAHLGQVLAKKNQWVKKHHIIGTIGRNYNTAENRWGPYHLHFDVSTTRILSTDPGHWPGFDGNEVVRHYTNPKNFIEDRR